MSKDTNKFIHWFIQCASSHRSVLSEFKKNTGKTGLKMNEKAANVQRKTNTKPGKLLLNTTLKHYKSVWLLGSKTWYFFLVWALTLWTSLNFEILCLAVFFSSTKCLIMHWVALSQLKWVSYIKNPPPTHTLLFFMGKLALEAKIFFFF